MPHGGPAHFAPRGAREFCLSSAIAGGRRRGARSRAGGGERRGRPRVLRWTLGIPAVALVCAVALYLLGMVWTWGEIQDAGVAPSDVIAAVPHSQIFGRGLQLAVLAVLALPLPLAFAWLLHRLLPEGGRPWGVPNPLGSLIADHRRLRRDLDELRGEADPTRPALEKRVSRLHARAAGQKAALDHGKIATRIVIAIAVAAGLFVLSPARLAVALLGVWLMRRASVSTLRVVLIMFGALVIAARRRALRGTAPLPDARVGAARGVLIKGPLVGRDPELLARRVLRRRPIKTIPTGPRSPKSSVYLACRRSVPRPPRRDASSTCSGHLPGEPAGRRLHSRFHLHCRADGPTVPGLRPQGPRVLRPLRGGRRATSCARPSCSTRCSRDFPERAALAREILLCEQEGDRITHDIIHRLNQTFVTPIDREDILELASALDDVVDLTEEAADYLVLYKIEAPMEQAQRLAHILLRRLPPDRRGDAAAARLRRPLRTTPSRSTASRTTATASTREAVASLFETGIDPMIVIRWKDIFERLEGAIDATEHVANVLDGIVIKNA